MKTRLFIIVMLFSLFLVACQLESKENKSANVTFKGGTDIWSAELHKVNNQEKQFILKYKGDSINTGNIEFKLNAPNWAWGMGGIKLDNEGIYVTEDINVDKISTSESDIIEVEIKWNDKVDTFTLKNE